MKRVLFSSSCCFFLAPQAHARQQDRPNQNAVFNFHNLVALTTELALAGLFYTWDDNAEGQLEGNPILDATDITHLTGSTRFNIPV